MIHFNNILFEKELSVTLTEATICQRITDFVISQGYTERRDRSFLSFQRGSPGSALFSISPTEWYSRITVYYDKEKSSIKLRVAVNSTGGLITPRNSTFWNDEFADLEKAVRGEPYPVRRSNSVKASPYIQILIFMFAGVPLIVAFLLGPAFGISSALSELISSDPPTTPNDYVLQGLATWWGVLAIFLIFIIYRNKTGSKPRKRQK